MSELKNKEDHIRALCGRTPVVDSHSALIKELGALFPDLSFSHALTRSGWYRVGGVVDSDFERVHENLRSWAEEASDHDMFALYETFANSDYLTTRLEGKSQYFVAPTGERAPDFVQVEIEELREVIDRPLFVDDHVPDDIEDLIDPPGGYEARLAPTPLSEPRYNFRELADIDELVADHVTSEGTDLRYIRFVEDWDRSSAGAKARFSVHFVLRMLPFRDRFGERKVEATPLFTGELPALDEQATELSGAPLANLLQEYDKQAGFPMAWYFTMPIRKKQMTGVAQAVYLDHQRNYSYLPERDLKVLEGWIRRPYSF